MKVACEREMQGSDTKMLLHAENGVIGLKGAEGAEGTESKWFRSFRCKADRIKSCSDEIKKYSVRVQKNGYCVQYFAFKNRRKYSCYIVVNYNIDGRNMSWTLDEKDFVCLKDYIDIDYKRVFETPFAGEIDILIKGLENFRNVLM